MMRPRSFALVATALLATSAFAAEVETITIKTLRAQMRYDVTEFDLKPGQKVKLVFQNDGDIWVVLCLTGSFNSSAPFRGWCVRVKPDGTMVPTCSGIRSPGRIVVNYDNEVYYTDNQGP